MSAYVNIPLELRNENHWLVWREETRNGKKTKVPYDAKTNDFAKTNDPATWTDFQTAVDAADPFNGNNYDGPGFVLLGTKLVGTDFDGVIDDGVPEPYVLNIISQFGRPYCEVTPSGTGLRVFVECSQLPPGNRKFSAKKKGVEKYGAEIYAGNEGARYLTVTGDRFSGDGVPKVDDISIPYLLISQFANAKFRRLWMGDASDYENDQSRADLAMLGLLERELKTQDKDTIFRFMNASPRGHRDKWVEREDYRERTFKKLVSGKKPESAASSDEVEQTAYGSEPAEMPEFQPRPKELEFHLSAVEKLKERVYVLGPNIGEKFGLFRRGQVSLVSGSSASGKTTLINQLMTTQALGADFLGYKTHGFSFVLLSRDRNQEAHEETMERMGLSLATIPFIRLPKNVWDLDAAQAVVAEIEKLNPLPEFVFVEGIDMLLSEMSIKHTTYFTGLLEDIAQHFQIALIASVGSPKAKKEGGYPAGRDNILGSSGWGRTIDTLWWMQFTKDGDTSLQRTLTIYPRNAATRKFTLGFADGQFEIQPDPVEVAHGEPKTVLEIDWFKKMARLGKTDPEKKWWTVVDIGEALNWSSATADRHVKNANTKRWIVKKAGAKAGRGRGRAEEYRWNESESNPLWVAEQKEIELELSI